jgi:[acyl-carrier-protein] S-malonyltransferase
MIEMGARRFIEIGPGKVLSGLLKRIDRSVEVTSVSDLQGIEKLQGFSA